MLTDEGRVEAQAVIEGTHSRQYTHRARRSDRSDAVTGDEDLRLLGAADVVEVLEVVVELHLAVLVDQCNSQLDPLGQLDGTSPQQHDDVAAPRVDAGRQERRREIVGGSPDVINGQGLGPVLSRFPEPDRPVLARC